MAKALAQAVWAAVIVGAFFAAPLAVLAQGAETQTITTCATVRRGDPLFTVVSRRTALARDYVPQGLTQVALQPQNAHGYQPVQLRRDAGEALLELLAAANRADVNLVAISGYRSYAEQFLAFQKWADLYPERVDAISARPGHSEHQLGLAVDFGTLNPYFNLAQAFARTPESAWLQANAAEYGFVLSYPDWAVAETGYDWEPWHYRYVGAPLAAQLESRRITLSTFVSRCTRAARFIPARTFR